MEPRPNPQTEEALTRQALRYPRFTRRTTRPSARSHADLTAHAPTPW